MSRRWLFVRVHGSTQVAAAVPTAVQDAARLVRAADPAACFFFDRVDDPAGDTVEVWLDARPDVRGEVAARLRVPGDGWLTAAGQELSRPVRHPHESERDVTDELAAVSSEFALASGGHRTQDEAFRLAVWHVRGLVGLSAGDPRALAFQCWLHWSARLAPHRRVDLSAQAALRAGRVPREPHPRLRTYLARTSEAVLGQRSDAGLPADYLLFAQATATHARLGLPPDVGAAAALTVRDELADRMAPALSGRPA